MQDQPSPYITHRHFNTALVSLFAALIVFVIYLSQLIDAANNKQLIAIEKQDAVFRRYLREMREDIAKEGLSNRERIASALESYAKTRDTALTSINQRFESGMARLDDRALSFSTKINAELNSIRSQVGLMSADMIALGRMQVTDSMLRRMIVETLDSRAGGPLDASRKPVSE